MGIEDMSREDLERAYLRAVNDRDFYKERADELTRKLAKTHQLMTNTSVPPREKIVLYGLDKELEISEPREDGLSHVYKSRLASKYGLSSDATGDSLKLLNEKGVIERKIEQHRNPETGKPEKINLVALGEIARKNPRAIDFSVGKKWGGLRTKGKRCEHCGSDDLQKLVHTQFFCKGCGSQVGEGDWKNTDLLDHSKSNSEMENNN